MSKYRLNALGDVEFEKLSQALVKRVIGPGTTTFGAGRDGAREATYEGKAPYPSTTDQWGGKWIFQAKFHDLDLTGVSAARTSILSEVEKELEKITRKYKYKVDNYILITNVPLSGVYATGTLDKLESVFSKYRKKIPHLKVWGADDVSRFLDLYPELCRPYLPLLITGDIIAELLTQVEQSRSQRATTIDMYLRTAISREENAQLDQAGDVSEDAIPLQRVFFDLGAYLPYATSDAMERYQRHPLVLHDIPSRELPMGGRSRISIARYLISDQAPDRTVIVGGPGEGKSTIGQYIAQLHRATLLNRAEDIAISIDYVPETPRIPFRVALKDFAQWLADNSADSSDTATLDAYISDQVTKVSTRTFVEKDLHEVLRTNPALLILDGLDEVTDAGVRRRLVIRLVEFLDRSQNTLRSNLQVIATTRPTNYSDQFDPKTFLHFHLHKLEDVQVRDYVNKWIIARVLEEDKAVRLKRTIDECLKDDQISLLMTTPLQVTILILIINSGGTPPRQREALFNEYLEVIYKREKAKGLDIVKTEKELLIGLHKFIGFLLHEEATKARTSSATLTRPAYDAIVRSYLREYDPYSSPQHIENEWHAITIDAGERLVLIVESPADVFGFELRSIQEFFAACFLSDTSSDTIQRYDRFEQIAYLPHWRNVALFFAGRVGRNYPGEAANIIEVCKDIDRRGPDVFVRRGAEVALELAAERALGPRRLLQRSLLEHGLGIFDISLSRPAREGYMELIQRLPLEDVRDHVLPILEQRLPALSNKAILNACRLLAQVAPTCNVLATHLMRLASVAETSIGLAVLDIVTSNNIPADLRINVIRSLVATGANHSVIGRRLAAISWSRLCSIAEQLSASDVDSEILEAFTSEAALDVPIVARSMTEDLSAEEQLDSFSAFVSSNSLLAIVLQCHRPIGILMSATSHTPTSRAGARRVDAARQRAAEILPTVVKQGDFSSIDSAEDSLWLLWLTHLVLGDVTPSSWARFVHWRSTFSFNERAAFSWIHTARLTLSPLALAISPDTSYGDLSGLAETAIALGGPSGSEEWQRRVAGMLAELKFLRRADLAKLTTFGPGILPPDVRRRVLQVLDTYFDLPLQPIVLDQIGGRSAKLSAEEFDRLSEWFNTLPPESPWKRRRAAGLAAEHAVRLKRLQTAEFVNYIPYLPDGVLSSIAIDAAVEASDEDLKFLLAQLNPSEQRGVGVRFAITIPTAKRRQVILRLLSMRDDSNADIRNGALLLVSEACASVVLGDAPSSRIRSRDLDEAHDFLVQNPGELERSTGIALYAVRPPRTVIEWEHFGALLMSATDGEIRLYWRWVLPHCAELASDVSGFVRHVSAILQDGVSEALTELLTDVLRKILSREGQSLSRVMAQLALPKVNIF